MFSPLDHVGLGLEVLSIHGEQGQKSSSPNISVPFLSWGHSWVDTQIDIRVSSPVLGKHLSPQPEQSQTVMIQVPSGLSSVITQVASQEDLISVPFKILFYRITLELWNNTKRTFSSGKYILEGPGFLGHLGGSVT